MSKWGAVKVVHVKTRQLQGNDSEGARASVQDIVTTMLDSQLHDVYRELELLDRDEQVKARAQADMFSG